MDLISIRTSGFPNYDRFWVATAGREALVFTVKSCGHATVSLSAVLYNTEVQVSQASNVSLVSHFFEHNQNWTKLSKLDTVFADLHS